MKKLAIVSSYNESCGNATYAYVLNKAFSEHVEVEVLALDLFLLQKGGPFYEHHGDAHIRRIAERLEAFDYVNIQFEAGLYGKTPADVFRRFQILLDACRNVVVTMHRVDPPGETLGEAVWQSVEKRTLRHIFVNRDRNSYIALYRRIVNHCRKRSRQANVWIAVHTRRERRIVADLYDFANVFDFPITFLFEEERRALLQSNATGTFRARYNIPPEVRVIGAFGFLGEYKGYGTLIRALQVLPANYHLYIFGGQHPQSIRRDLEVDPYLGTLLEEIEKERTPSVAALVRAGAELLGSLGESGESVGELLSRLGAALTPARIRTSLAGAVDRVVDNLTERVRFIGALPDAEFLEALHFSDAVVLPYLEVGQSMSGVIVLALECGAKLLCSNNLSFNEASKYYGTVYERFDIGNHLELAQKLRATYPDFGAQREAAYETYNLRRNIARYLEAYQHAA